ncbi:DUF4180 domain-containing protein [Gorillibacterium sp. sgz500922]|uniref:DUF4180 domain-containing protein n=1 Tax=Gorillibacterium sp. sgz500922 TaxID=3446694 RepID=UPI003F664FD1
MAYPIAEDNGSRVALISREDVQIGSIREALDLMATVQYQGCDKMLLRKEQLPEEFFRLTTGFAGELLQKFATYRMKLAIAGDFQGYDSKSLRDFMYECNQGSQVQFKPSEAEALEALHRLA